MAEEGQRQKTALRSRWDLVAVVLAAVIYLAAPASIDPDLWGHVRFGQDMLRDGIVHEVDPYSYLTAGVRWINHEVLSEISFGWIYNRLGGLGLSALRLAIILATAALLLAHLMAAGLNAIRAGAIVIAVQYGLSLGVPFVRPQLFTYLFFALMMGVIDRIDRGRIGFIWAASPIVALWANYHGGFLAGVGILGIWLAVDLVRRCIEARSLSALARPQALTLMAGGLVTLGATLATPYGWDLIEFLLRTATTPRPEIDDWQPIALFSLTGAAYAALLLASLWAIVRGRAVSPAHLAAWLTAAYLPFSAARHLPLFALAGGFLLARSFANAWNQASPPKGSGADLAPGWRRPALHLALSACLLLAAAPRFTAGIQVDPRVQLFPVRAVSWLDQAGVEGNLATHFSWGEYVIWELGPRVQVSIDGRRETVYPPDIYSQNLAFHFGQGDWDAILTEHATDMVLAPRTIPMFERMQQAAGWSLAYDDELCGLFVREGFEAERLLRATPIPQVSINGLGMRFD